MRADWSESACGIGRLVTAGALTAAIFAAPVHAQSEGGRSASLPDPIQRSADIEIPSAIRDQVSENLAQLDAPSWEVRSKAADWFFRAEVSDFVLERLLDASYLSAEQRSQLLAVLQERILAAPAPAIGVQMMVLGQLEEGVRVTGLVAGMPGEKVLRRRDRITHIDGIPIFNTDDVRKAIAALKPGDVIVMRIRRPIAEPNELIEVDPDDANPGEEEVFDVELELGHADRLNDNRHSRDVAVEREKRVYQLIENKGPQPLRLVAPEPISIADEDARITKLREDLERWAEGRLSDEDKQRLMLEWQKTRIELRNAIRDPGISEDEQDRLTEIHNRFVEILRMKGF